MEANRSKGRLVMVQLCTSQPREGAGRKKSNNRISQRTAVMDGTHMQARARARTHTDTDTHACNQNEKVLVRNAQRSCIGS
eukprot:1148079-Pelagomonas_calceolata.AAC.1